MCVYTSLWNLIDILYTVILDLSPTYNNIFSNTSYIVSIRYDLIWDRKNLKMAISFWDSLPAEQLTSASQGQSSELLLFWVLQTESRRHIGLRVEASTPRRRNKIARAAVVMSFVLFVVSVTISFQRRWQLLTVRGVRMEREPSFPTREASSPPLNLSSSLHQWVEQRDKVFLTIWRMGIRDGISLGPPQTVHLVE